MAAQLHDIHGRLLDVEVNQRSVGIGIKALPGKDPVIAILRAVKSKLRRSSACCVGAIFNVLITDDTAARKVLALEEALTKKS